MPRINTQCQSRLVVLKNKANKKNNEILAFCSSESCFFNSLASLSSAEPCSKVSTVVMVWYDMVWYGMVWFSMVYFDTIHYITPQTNTTITLLMRKLAPGQTNIPGTKVNVSGIISFTKAKSNYFHSMLL